MLIEMLKPDFIHSDDRGSLTQLVREGFKQINVIESKQGSLRGGHYHVWNREAFFIVSGKIKLTVNSGIVKETYNFCGGDMFLIPPHISHDFFYEEDTILISMYDQGVELSDGSKDIVIVKRE